MTAPLTIAAYAAQNTLIIPEGLADFADASLVMGHGGQAIYHKLIRDSMHGVEFYTNAPCLCFPARGTETFATGDGSELIIAPGNMILMPQNSFMVSDFTNADGPLEAFLFFFDQSVIDDFLRRSPLDSVEPTPGQQAYQIAAHDSLSAYMHALHAVYGSLTGSAELLRTKLMELLFLIAEVDQPRRLRAFLRTCNATPARRNIRHLMRQHYAHNLSVADYARLSGRSVSAFSREFKRQFGIAPRDWLTNMRLDRAESLLAGGASVTEIGLEVGYANTSHFIAQFRKRFGQTPTQHRARLA